MAHRTNRGAIALALALLLFALAPPVAAQHSERAKKLGKQLMCMCGCNQILTGCNHVGCAVSARMLKEMDERVKSDESDELILQSFIQEYGERALLVPPAKGFNLAAWVLPILVPLGGLALVALVLLRWRHHARMAPAPKVPDTLLARARREADREDEA